MNTESTPITTPFDTPPAEGEATLVADGVLWMRQPLPMKLDHVNIYALDEGDGWTVIDTGFDSKRSRAVWEKLLAGPMDGKPVTRVIATHHHPDHIGLAGWFMRQGAELWTTRTAYLTARMLTLDEQALPPEETIAFWQSCGMAPEVLEQRRKDRPFNFADVVTHLPLGYHRIHEGETIRIGGRDWEVHLGNGHAPEHATFWSRDDHLVISGDQVLATISPNIGVYPTEPGADPLAEWLEACERLQQFARPDQLVLPGHKLPFSGLPTRMRQLIDNHHGALDRLLQELNTPKTAAECFHILFKRQIGPAEYGLALVESMAHVQHLWKLGKMSRRRRDDGAWLWQTKDAS